MALALHPVQRGGAVVDPVRDVVDALALLLEVLRDRRVVAHRSEELDVRLGDTQQHFLDAVLVDDLAMHRLDPVRGAVVVDGTVEVSHRDGHVVDLGQDRVSHVLTPCDDVGTV